MIWGGPIALPHTAHPHTARQRSMLSYAYELTSQLPSIARCRRLSHTNWLRRYEQRLRL